MGGLLATAHATAEEGDTIPHLGDKGTQAYRQFKSAPVHRAFALAPGGAWAWSSDQSSRQRALDRALERCTEHTQQHCVPYAVDEETVFDVDLWPTLWGPYSTREEAEASSVGTRRWQRFPNLRFSDDTGNPVSLSKWQGKVLLLHFWGTWCAYCLPELKGLQALQQELSNTPEIEFVLLQVREAFTVTSGWAKQEGLSLPLYDSGSRSEEDDTLQLSDGSTIPDREVAQLFPTTYILDKHGTVLYARSGPAPDWREYAPFLRHAAAHSGKQ